MPNALASEKSPYLLQHAHNPVDWLPWGAEAFARARAEDKMVFLSIGYSTCHWCHVMEHESFENEAIAAQLNADFISVKVDREERPDVDATFMAFVVATTGHGGWPMSVWLTPAGEPVYGGTYFPPQDRTGRAGFPTILRRLAEVWKNDRDQVTTGAARAMAAMRGAEEAATLAATVPGEAVFSTAFDQLSRTYDPDLGGFGRAPKFPRPSLFLLLERLARRLGPESPEGKRCRHMADHTLACMALGGLQDQIGGGFHRYSVDAYWHVPHFEKMLYDQAQLAVAYAEAWQAGGNPLFRRTCEDILAYVQRDLTDAAGGFHSAEDADSLLSAAAREKVEGGFYTWALDEVGAWLTAEEAKFFTWYYWVTEEGNARPESDPLGELTGRNTLFVAHSVDEAVAEFGRTPEEIRELIRLTRDKLFAVREARPRPHKDDKVITAWNGLMISAFSRAAAVLDRADLLEPARRALGFLKREAWHAADGTLRRSWRQGAGPVRGFADDYAFLIQGCLDFYEAAGEIEWLQWGIALQEKMDALFWQAARSAYVMGAGDDVIALAPNSEIHDGAEPAAGSVAAMNLLRLAAMLDRRDFCERAEEILRATSVELGRHPFGVPCLAAALDFALAAPVQIVITAGTGNAALRAAAHAAPLASRVILHADGGDGQMFLAGFSPPLALMKPAGRTAVAYVCHHFSCQPPVTAREDLRALLAAG